MSGAGCRVEEKQKNRDEERGRRKGTKQTDAAGCEFQVNGLEIQEQGMRTEDPGFRLTTSYSRPKNLEPFNLDKGCNFFKFGISRQDGGFLSQSRCGGKTVSVGN